MVSRESERNDLREVRANSFAAPTSFFPKKVLVNSWRRSEREQTVAFTPTFLTKRASPPLIPERILARRRSSFTTRYSLRIPADAVPWFPGFE
jgi:hypothetical protein